MLDRYPEVKWVEAAQANVSTAKTYVPRDQVLRFLQAKYPVRSFSPIIGGQIARAFLFCAGDQEYVIRIRPKKQKRAFLKDKYASLHFSTLPIPEIVEIGRYDWKYSYCISRRAPGATADRVKDDCIPVLLHTLEQIRRTDVRSSTGYGVWNRRGKGNTRTWNEYLRSQKEGFPEALIKLRELLRYCPEERYLVHRDFGFDNVVLLEGQVTGVLDWSESKYGDFVYDIAWLDFFSDDNVASYVKDEIPNFRERLGCYKLFIGLKTLEFFARSSQDTACMFIRERLERLLSSL